MIRFENASVTYPGGVHALKNLTLEIPDGQMVVIVGLSGAGKSTLIRAINGLVPLSSGDVTIDGASVRDAKTRELRQIRSKIGMIFQTFNLVKRTSVLNNVLMGRLHSTGTLRSLLAWYRPEDVEIAMRALERVDIVEKAYVRASNLSGGQQQRVGIARALALQPKLMLFDEPTSALDPELVGDVLRVIKDLAAEGWTMVIVTHEIRFAQQVADQVLFLDGGVVLESGPPAQVLTEPTEARTRQFLERILNPI